MNLKNKLKNLTQSMNPENMMMGMLDQFLPQIKTFADKLNKPEAEGGILQEGEGMATLMVDFSTEKPSVYVATLKQKDDDTILNRAIDLQDLIAKTQEDGNEG